MTESPYKQKIDEIRDLLTKLVGNIFRLFGPTGKRYRDNQKKLRIAIISFIVPFIFVIFKLKVLPNEFRLGIWAIVIFVLAILAVLGTAWALYFKLHKRFWPLLVLVFAYISVSFMFLAILFLLPITERFYLLGGFLILVVIIAVIFHILLLSINIMNVNLFYYIPLSDLGETITYLVSSVMIFMFSYVFYIVFLRYITTIIIYKLIVFLLGAFILYVVVSFAFIYYYFAVFMRSFKASVFFAVIFLTFSIVSSFLFKSPLYMALLLTVAYFTTIGIFIHDQKNTYSDKVVKTYVLLDILLFLILIISVI